jgi:hypothetical protein
MTELEDRLKRQLRELSPRSGARTRRWLVSLAAAAAVVIIIAVVMVESGVTGGGSAPTGPTSP